MRRFRFGLDAVLRMRERREHAARQQFAQSRAKVDALANGLERLRNALARQHRWARMTLGDAGQAGVDMEFYRQALQSVQAEYGLQVQRLWQAREAEQQDRAILLAAMRHRKALERLRQRRQARHEATQQRAATAELDDLYVSDRKRGAGFSPASCRGVSVPPMRLPAGQAGLEGVSPSCSKPQSTYVAVRQSVDSLCQQGRQEISR